jgi:integrase
MGQPEIEPDRCQVAGKRPTIPLTRSQRTPAAIPRGTGTIPSRAAGIKTKIGNHSLRVTGITDYLKSAGTLEHAQAMANHSSARTTELYDRRADEVSPDEYEWGFNAEQDLWISRVVGSVSESSPKHISLAG